PGATALLGPGVKVEVADGDGGAVPEHAVAPGVGVPQIHGLPGFEADTEELAGDGKEALDHPIGGEVGPQLLLVEGVVPLPEFFAVVGDIPVLGIGAAELPRE